MCSSWNLRATERHLPQGITQWLHLYNRSTTPLELPGTDWGGDPPPWPGMWERERGITQCYLPPHLYPSQSGSRDEKLSWPQCCLYTEMVYLSADSHLSKYKLPYVTRPRDLLIAVPLPQQVTLLTAIINDTEAKTNNVAGSSLETTTAHLCVVAVVGNENQCADWHRLWLCAQRRRTTTTMNSICINTTHKLTD